MNFIAFIVISLASFFAYKHFVKSYAERIFLVVFTVSTIYYGILGPWYWWSFREAAFLGVDWSDMFTRVVGSFLLVHLIVVATLSWGGRSVAPQVADLRLQSRSKTTWLEDIILLLGAMACVYVVVVGANVSAGMELTDDPYLLIFLQLSNLPIAVLLYWVGRDGLNFRWLVLCALYVGFAVIVGLRYKIILLLAPLILFLYFYPKKHQLLVRGGMIFSGVVMLALFAIMTITRDKFSGLNLDNLATADFEMYMFGLFAETSVIFSLASALSIFGNNVEFVGLTPVFEAFTQFIPRFMYPEKHLYGHLEDMMWGLGHSMEALNAKTMPPFFAEYYAMFGWGGVIVGTVLYTLGTVYSLRYIKKIGVSARQILVASSLLIVFVGYYYFSRGSIAQIFRGIIFIGVPYFIFMYRDYKAAKLVADKRDAWLSNKVN